MRILVAIIVIAAATPTLACMDDTDCDSGAKCLKGSGIYGVCIGGKSSNAHDVDPRKDIPLDINGPTEKTCADDGDCGPGSICQQSVCTDHQ
jgi:hypothetical protein